MIKYFLVILLVLCVLHSAFAQFTLAGKVLDAETEHAIEYAAIVLKNHERWATTNENGEFRIKNIPAGTVEITVSHLGHARQTFTLNVAGDSSALIFYLPEDNLALPEVVVTAKSGAGEMATTYTIDRVALEHLQMLGLNDVMSLLPGGQTNRALHLAGSSPQLLALRSGGTSEMGNPTFGTAIEVDGVRLSNNATYESSTSGQVYGTDTRSIASGNIESVEVITGVASVEYGDLNNGVVKVNTRKGKSPLHVEMATKPHTKQIAAGKGFKLGDRAGTVNLNVESTKSISNLSSPYTAYRRNSVSLLYENTFNKNASPLMLTAGVSGNVGGYDSKADPDAFRDTYRKERDNSLRTHFKLNWLPNSRWITGVEMSGSLSYSDKMTSENTNRSNSSSTPAIHGREEGYFVSSTYEDNPEAAVLLIPAGYWYQLEHVDSKPLSLNGNIKIKQNRRLGKVHNNLMLGIDAVSSGNLGRGRYFADLRYAPDWREYRYNEIPFMNSAAIYVEDKASIALRESLLQLTAGLRSEMTFINRSEYGTVSSLSPRVNARYTSKNMPEGFVRRFSLRAGWGKFVKQPSFAVLYPSPTYRDVLSFAPGAMADGSIFYAYHILPNRLQYNPELRWQYNDQLETGMEIKMKGATVNLSAYYTRTFDSYRNLTEYLPFSYKFTGQGALEGIPVPSVNRMYSVDRTSGVVTVIDKTGQHPAQELAYRERHTFRSVHKYTNSSPLTRKGVEWTVSFDEIKALRTSIRLDGNWYSYRGLDETLEQYSPTAQNMADGNPYKYVGIYAGGNGSSNGSESRRLNTNLTFTTHIPAVRLIISLKIESTLDSRTQRLSEYQAKVRGFAVDRDNLYFPAANRPDEIYNSDRYAALYPLWYISLDDMNTPVPFAQKFEWARDNDRPLYNELAKLVQSSNTDYYFNAARLSSYYSANISITKEIGSFARVSFNALNFTNNMQQIKSSDTGLESTIYASSYIPAFYYGLSLKLIMNH